MPLIASNLAQDLLDLTRNFPQSPFEAGNRWAASYAAYAKEALSPAGGFPITLDANERVLGATLGAMFANPANPPPATAQTYATAFTAFWFSPPVAFTEVPPAAPGIVTAVLGTAALPPALLEVWASNLASRAPNEAAVQKIAGALDAFTRTVIVTHLTPGPPVVGPIS